MTPRLSKSRTREKGWALLVVMSLSATALLIMASVVSWSNENAAVVARNNETFATTYAAEAATEKVLAQVVQDDQDYGEGWVFTRTATYGSVLPTASDNSYWTNYQFSGGSVNNSIIVTRVISNSTTLLTTPYAGLVCIGATYEIIANAQKINSEYGIVATVGQQLILGQVPIFQFAIFYNDFMEIDPGANMDVTGLVHGNTNVNLGPNSGVTLTFNNNVSATGTLNKGANSYNSSSSGSGTVDFIVPSTAGVIPLNLPIGTNVSGTSTNVGQNVNAILQVPPAGESAGSSTGTNRLFNQADIIVLISNGNTITVTSGVEINNQATVVPTNQASLFLSTNGTFWNGREQTNVFPVVINVGALRQWSATNTAMRSALSSAPSRSSLTADVQSVYVADMRTSSTNEPGIVLTNGAALPSNGLSVASPDPVYVVGYWNVTTNVNSSGTPINLTTQSYQVTNTLPSAIYTDAITILSPAWSPTNCTKTTSLTSRAPTPDTVNAAILTGNVPSVTGSYSGGVENFLRLLEDWSSSIPLYYNGSMVQLFTSQIAKAPWVGTGNYYNPPARDWAFDTNFLNPSQLPPLTPKVIYLERAQWNTLPPRTTQF